MFPLNYTSSNEILFVHNFEVSCENLETDKSLNVTYFDISKTSLVYSHLTEKNYDVLECHCRSSLTLSANSLTLYSKNNGVSVTAFEDYSKPSLNYVETD